MGPGRPFDQEAPVGFDEFVKSCFDEPPSPVSPPRKFALVGDSPTPVAVELSSGSEDSELPHKPAGRHVHWDDDVVEWEVPTYLDVVIPAEEIEDPHPGIVLTYSSEEDSEDEEATALVRNAAALATNSAAFVLSAQVAAQVRSAASEWRKVEGYIERLPYDPWGPATKEEPIDLTL